MTTKKTKTAPPPVPDVHDARAMGRLGGKARAEKLSPERRREIAAMGGRLAKGWPKGKPRGPRTNWGASKPFGRAARAPYAILYGAEGQDFPKVFEDGPYDSVEAARAGIDQEVAAKLGGWTIVAGWQASDGQRISTGKGQVIERLFDQPV
jgi:hypothetical protein